MAQTIPPTYRTLDAHLRLVSNTINGILDGKHNATGEVTLTVSSATTVVTDSRVGASSVITFMPMTLQAAQTIITGFFVSSVGDQTFTITHANNAQASRTFSYTISG